MQQDLDPAIALHLADPRNSAKPPPPHISLDVARAAANVRMAEAPRPEVHAVENTDFQVDGRRVPVRIYRPGPGRDLPLVLFAHGGGWVWGSLDSHDGVCRHLAIASGAVVIAVDYRLSPETPFPGPLDDVVAALRWAITNADRLGVDSDRIALCGDSSGGHLMLATARLAVREGRPLRYLALIYPPVDPACDSASQAEFAEGHLLTNETMRWFWAALLGSDGPPDGDLHAPLNADLTGLPPTTVALAWHDVLRDEGVALARRLHACGVTVTERMYPTMIHAFISLGNITPVAAEALNAVGGDMRAALATRKADGA
ncbi:alpha/beta hydrolase [Rhizobiaceae bacterium]|nr:alpha/beta hydrolase [Rhizobiaceae bacterium]